MKKQTLPAVLLVCMMVFMILGSSASAVEVRASEYLKRYSANVTKTRDGNIAVSYSVTAVQKMDSIGVTRIEIQRYNGSSWTTEKVYTSAEVPEFQVNNAATHRGELIHTPEESGSYRALVTVYAKVGNGSDSRVVTTDSV